MLIFMISLGQAGYRAYEFEIEMIKSSIMLTLI